MLAARISVLALVAMLLSGCITTSMQGYADRELPKRPVQRVATLVIAPGPLGASLQSSIFQEARNKGLFVEDALTAFPPTRNYTNTEIRSGLARDRIDAVLVVTVGDSGVMKEYAGTFFFGEYNGSSNAVGTATTFGNVTNLSLNGTSSGTLSGSAVPMHRYSRNTVFQARLVEASSGRTLWVGSGQVQAGGLLFVGNGVSATSAASAIFNDLQNKGLIGAEAS